MKIFKWELSGDNIVVFWIFLIIPLGLFVSGTIFSLMLNSSNLLLSILLSMPLLIDLIGWHFIHQRLKTVSSEFSDLKKAPETVEETIEILNHQKELSDLNRTPETAEETVKILSHQRDLQKDNEKPKYIEAASKKFSSFYNRTMLFSVALYCIGWLGYNSHSENWIFPIVCYFGIGCQFLIMSFVTYVIMETSGKKESWYNFSLLKRGLELHPFWRIAHFFAIFMSISFLFGFAFAFHDAALRKINDQKPALYIENLASDEPTSTTLPIVNQNNAMTVSQNNSTVEDLSKPFCFFFESDNARIIFEEESRYSKDENLKEEELKYIKDFKSISENERKGFMRRHENYKSLYFLLKKIRAYKAKGIARITLVGRTDDKKSSSLYPSNYALSEARTETIKSEVIRNFNEWQNIDWLLIARSNENFTNQSINGDSINQCKCKDLSYDVESGKPIEKSGAAENPVKNDKSELENDPDSGKRVVEAYLSIVSPDSQSPDTKEFWENQVKETEKNKYKNPPSLMDYMYFSIYTITTTGYGDIKPATNQAKFLVSLENFFEVFFLVCFMNTLLALKNDSRKPPESKQVS